jgi:hypothetical protein
MLPEASQARKTIWEAINPHTGKRRIDEALPPALRDTTRENEMIIHLKVRVIWQVVGSDNYNSLVGAPPIEVVFSEWALDNPAAWGFLRPVFAEKKPTRASESSVSRPATKIPTCSSCGSTAA